MDHHRDSVTELIADNADTADRRFEAKEWHTPRVAVPLETNSVTAHATKV